MRARMDPRVHQLYITLGAGGGAPVSWFRLSRFSQDEQTDKRRKSEELRKWAEGKALFFPSSKLTRYQVK